MEANNYQQSQRKKRKEKKKKVKKESRPDLTSNDFSLLIYRVAKKSLSNFIDEFYLSTRFIFFLFVLPVTISRYFYHYRQ